MMERDEDLLARALKGDSIAFSSLYRNRQAPVYRFALQMTGDVMVAEDATQEVFLALLDGRARFDASRGPLASFLYGVARNIVLRRLERERSYQELDEYASDADVLDNLERAESVEQVRKAVLSLPPAYREVVALCDLGEATYEQAAGIVGCPIGTVRSRLSRARVLLAEKLEGVSCVRA